MSCVCNS